MAAAGVHKIDSKLTEPVRYRARWHDHALRACYGDAVTRCSIRLNHTKRYIRGFVRFLRSKNRRLYDTRRCTRLTTESSSSGSLGFVNTFGRSCVLTRLASELATAQVSGLRFFRKDAGDKPYRA